MSIEIAFGKLLREHRAASQFTQADLALRAGLAVSFVSRMERGQVCPTIGTLLKIANAFDVRPELLVMQLCQITDNNSGSLGGTRQALGMEEMDFVPDARTLLAANVQRLRTKMGISQEALSDLAGFHATYVSRVERCMTNASTDNVQKLADTLSVPVARLFEVPSSD